MNVCGPFFPSWFISWRLRCLSSLYVCRILSRISGEVVIVHFAVYFFVSVVRCALFACTSLSFPVGVPDACASMAMFSLVPGAVPNAGTVLLEH